MFKFEVYLIKFVALRQDTAKRKSNLCLLRLTNIGSRPWDLRVDLHTPVTLFRLG
jgi:hypothetical protein